MDPRLGRHAGSINGILLGNGSFAVQSQENAVGRPGFQNTILSRNFQEFRCLAPDPSPSNIASSSSFLTSSSNASHEEDYLEDCDFSDAVLRFINQILMEEDMEDKTCMLQDSLDLQAAEKSFYDVLGKKYPPSPEPNRSLAIQYSDSFNGELCGDSSNYLNSYNNTSYSGDDNPFETLDVFQIRSTLGDTISPSSNSSSNSIISGVDGLVDFSNNTIQVPESNNRSQSIWQFQKGFEEASKFLPGGNDLCLDFDVNGSVTQGPDEGTSQIYVKAKRKDQRNILSLESRVRKNPHDEDGDLEEERSSKQAAVFTESTLRSKMFDIVLLCSAGEGHDRLASFRQELQNAKIRSMMQTGQLKQSSGGRGRRKKQSGKKEVVDLRTLLISCAQAVAADDHRNATELLKQIRQHASPFGDGNQRLASCFADGLEARLAGTGSQIYKGLINKRTSAADVLKAYHLYLAACPFRKISNFTSNRTIMNAAENATRLHVIDFGILYGFQWPTLIQRLSWRKGGPPKLRITGIEFPQPGFRPAERVEETGRRLATYAESFNVPFEYNAIAKKWETITVEDLNIDKDEFLVVNCLYRAKNLLDESVSTESPRNTVLRLIHKINPNLFIHGVVNGAYNAPFFVTRFREALFHFSAIFDMLETIVPREDWERMLLEKEIFGREALNVIACEGWERVERPETYKQWQFRIMRAGFVQLPIGPEIFERAVDKVRSSYHRDFLIDEDSRWILQGWKGRIIYAISAWRPAIE
ncbi:scarecrow-like protein 9 [Momordica charantia]|uniref:Scarecrow-like protein 9 n=1 Tax=Momordica charantia TaxID=3673 RepID=A0A6J1CVV6_MOMCH|nr:scarecrow-like protein 9 [Momordica charantia]XP_022145649.1 scarecrow-like protein 9 [Momordica charantia]